MNDELRERADEAKKLIDETGSVDDKMKQLRAQLHQIAAGKLFEIFPFLPDGMEPDEIRHLGARINRHLFNLTEELKNFSYTVQKRIEE